MATILRYAVWARWGPDEVDERLALADRLVATAARAGSIGARLHAHGTRIHFALESGVIESAQRDLATYLELARTARRPWFDWSARRFRIMLALLTGEHAAAEQEIAESTSRARTFEHPDVLALFYAQMVALRMQQDRVAEIIPFLIESVRRPTALPAWKCALTYAQAAEGDHAAARALLLELGAHDFADLPRDFYWKSSLAFLADAAALLYERDVAAALYRALLPYQDDCANIYGVVSLGAVQRPLARLAHLLGRRRDARRHFAAAARLHERMGALPWFARTLYEHARLCPRNAERSALLERARHAAEKVGLASLVERCAELEAQ